MRKDKKIAMGAGIVAGGLQSYILRTYANTPIPVIGDYLGNFGTWASLGNIIIGGLAFGISTFIKPISDEATRGLQAYGITNIAGGIINGVFPATALRAPVRRAMTGSGDGYYTKEYYPGFVDGFYRRPESRARGFASDVTRNPMAAIPTTVPYDIVLF